jgi:hypothetical protein
VTFADDSKYKGAPLRQAQTPEGRAVNVVATPAREVTETLGWLRRRQGQRLDLIADRHLNGPGDWWRLPDHNNRMLPDAAAQMAEMAIPKKPRDR